MSQDFLVLLRMGVLRNWTRGHSQLLREFLINLKPLKQGECSVHPWG